MGWYGGTLFLDTKVTIETKPEVMKLLRVPLLIAPLLLLGCTVSAQNCPRQAKPVPTSPIHVHDVVFTNISVLSPEVLDEISRKVHKEATTMVDGPPESVARRDEDQGASNLADETAERVRLAYEDAGYFNVKLIGRMRRIDTDHHPLYDILVTVIDTGLRYRLGDLSIANAAFFPAQELRDLFPLQSGDVFSREKIVKGLEVLRSLYTSAGYVNATSVPFTDFDNDNLIANIRVDVDEGKQFRIRSVHILGVDSEEENRIMTSLPFRSGDVFSKEAWERSIRDFHATGDPKVGEMSIDEKNGLVDLSLDLREPEPCR